MSDRRTRARTLAVIAWGLIAWGLALAGTFVLKPWVSCEEEDSSAGCPVPPEASAYADGVYLAAPVSVVAGVLLVRAYRRSGPLG